MKKLNEKRVFIGFSRRVKEYKIIDLKESKLKSLLNNKQREDKITFKKRFRQWSPSFRRSNILEQLNNLNKVFNKFKLYRSQII